MLLQRQEKRPGARFALSLALIMLLPGPFGCDEEDIPDHTRATAGLAFALTRGMYGIVGGFTTAMFGLGIAEPALASLSIASQKTALGFTTALMGSLHLMLSSLSTPI